MNRDYLTAELRAYGGLGKTSLKLLQHETLLATFPDRQLSFDNYKLIGNCRP